MEQLKVWLNTFFFVFTSKNISLPNESNVYHDDNKSLKNSSGESISFVPFCSQTML